MSLQQPMRHGQYIASPLAIAIVVGGDVVMKRYGAVFGQYRAFYIGATEVYPYYVSHEIKKSFGAKVYVIQDFNAFNGSNLVKILSFSSLDIKWLESC
jgi:hypothetical protein